MARRVLRVGRMAMTSASTTPYRTAATELGSREKVLEQELAETRAKLNAFGDEERRLERELAELRIARDALVTAEEQLDRDLADVRGDLVATGQRKMVTPRSGASRSARALVILVVAFIALVAADWARRTNTAVRPPPGVSSPWGGPTAAGRGWFYVEAPPNTVVKVDSDFAAAPARLDLSVLEGHDFRFDARAHVRVRPIPCTTAVVRYDGAGVDVDRFFNSATCF